jgi:hypothetical protein
MSFSLTHHGLLPLPQNWQLREAALAKMTLLTPSVCGGSSAEECAEILCNIVVRSIGDKNVQVYLAGLILLDESLLQFERSELPQTKITPLLSKIIIELLGKLAESKTKVVDSAELSLLSIAHSSCVDISYICNAGTKRVKSTDSKGGRTVKARLQFMDNLIAEFGDEVGWKRVLEFAIGKVA